MSDFLMDYSNLTGAGAAFKGFAQGWQDADDRRLKKMELDSRLKTQEQDRTRQAIMDKLSLQKAGYTQGDDGDLEEVPWTERQKEEHQLSGAEKGLDVSYDENGHQKLSYNPNSPQMQAAKMRGMSAVNAMGRVETAKDNQSSQAVDKITNDSQLKAHTQRLQGADRILGQLADVKSGKIVDTNQFLNDLNTEYVNLLTGANNSALGKQERTEYRTASGDLASVLQRLRAKPESINSPEILKQLETSVNGLRDTYQRNFALRAQALKRHYAHNPDAEAQQQNAIDNMVGQSSGQGLMGPPQGLLNQNQGLIQPGVADSVMAAKVQRLQELRAKAAAGGQ